VSRRGSGYFRDGALRIQLFFAQPSYANGPVHSCDIGDPQRSFARRTPADILGHKSPATPSRRDVSVKHAFHFPRVVIEVVAVEEYIQHAP
jgi:hypothetical protein